MFCRNGRKLLSTFGSHLNFVVSTGMEPFCKTLVCESNFFMFLMSLFLLLVQLTVLIQTARAVNTEFTGGIPYYKITCINLEMWPGLVLTIERNARRIEEQKVCPTTYSTYVIKFLTGGKNPHKKAAWKERGEN